MRFQEFRVLNETEGALSAITQVADLANTYLNPFGSLGKDTGKDTSGGIAVPGRTVSTTANADIKAIQDPNFNKKLEKIANALGVKASDLLAIMKFESRLNPQAVNKYSKATGLIQFMPDTARSLGTSTEELYKMSAVEQLDYVYKYYKQNKLKPGSTAGDIYVNTFYPAAANQGNDFVIGQKGAPGLLGKRYSQNAVLDYNKNNVITVADVKKSINSTV